VSERPSYRGSVLLIHSPGVLNEPRSVLVALSIWRKLGPSTHGSCAIMARTSLAAGRNLALPPMDHTRLGRYLEAVYSTSNSLTP
jgi:hypothetical protein